MSQFFGLFLGPHFRRRPRPSGALTARSPVAAERVPEAGELSEERNSCCDAHANGRSTDDRTGAPERATGPVAVPRASRGLGEGRTDRRTDRQTDGRTDSWARTFENKN